jgi:hypothetical protein
MTSDTKRKIQWFLVVAILVTGARTGYLLYQRHASQASPTQPRELPLNADYYVTPKKLYPYDLKSARQLAQQPVWVKEGYRYTYYPYANHRTDFAHQAGQLLPIEKLEIKDVVTDISPGSPDQRQVMAVFEKDDKTYAFPIGYVKDGDYKIYSDEILYIQDPRDLYKHWPADIWQAIEQHQVKPGMNELQADFAIGMGVPDRSTDSDFKTVRYPNGGQPLVVIYQNGKASEIRPGL